MGHPAVIGVPPLPPPGIGFFHVIIRLPLFVPLVSFVVKIEVMKSDPDSATSTREDATVQGKWRPHPADTGPVRVDSSAGLDYVLRVGVGRPNNAGE
jgi:hypothetical protein